MAADRAGSKRRAPQERLFKRVAPFVSSRLRGHPLRSGAVDLIPKVFVAGLFAAAQPGPADREKINRIWTELSTRQDYRQLSFTGDGAQLVGTSGDDALLVQLPLVQYRSTARLGLQNAADEAEVALKTVAKHLSIAQFYNLGIKHVYHAPVPTKEARAFILRNLLGKDADDLASLQRGGGIWGGVKYGTPSADGSLYALIIEPLLADDRFIFIDLDAQFPGPADPDRVRDRARDVEDYASRVVLGYLDSMIELG
jgi:hypothetical protein